MVHRAIAKRLSRQDWVDAALRSTAQVGLENVSVEALAKTLNATKGSFYWHFTDRAELVDAALAEWQRRTTTEVFDGIGHTPTEDPVARLMDRVLSLGRADDEAADWRIMLAAEHPQIGPAVARAHAVRIGLVTDLLIRRGFDPGRAEARARVAYAAYLGNRMLMHSSGTGKRPDSAALKREFLAAIQGDRPGR